MEDKLDIIHKMFLGLYNNVVYLKKVVNANPTLYIQHIMNIKRIIDEFLQYDTYVLSIYPQLLVFGKENEIWKELVNHIISEQTFMLELFKDLRQQIR
jgi:hypothetical protein